jgi:integrase
MPPKKTTPPSSVKTYASRPGYTELRYRIGSTLKREFVADAKASARRKQIEADLLKFRAPLTDREIEEYRAAVYLLPTGTTLTQAVTEFAKTAPTQPLDWSSAIEAFEEHECGRVDQRTLKDRKAQLTDLALAPGTASPSHLTSAVLRTHLATFTSPQTANHRRSTYALFMDWYLDHTGDTRPNPVRAVKSRKVAASDPVPFSYVDRDRLIETAIAEKNATALFVLVLGSFCGIRSCEIERLTFGDVFEEAPGETLRREISLSSTITKTNRRRVVPIHPGAEALFFGTPTPSPPATVEEPINPS